jgi:sporadic carbohydrate cluster protein (TIGR04323 family)
VAATRFGHKGYVSSRRFGDHAIPVPVQSLVLRDYCTRKGFTYVLPVNENAFPNSYLVLEGLIADLSGDEGVLMCSFHMLPQRTARRRAIMEKVVGQGASLHFVLEDLVVANQADIAEVEALIAFADLARRAPAPRDVLA